MQDLLPAQISLDSSKSSALLMGWNSADWAVWESVWTFSAPAALMSQPMSTFFLFFFAQHCEFAVTLFDPSYLPTFAAPTVFLLSISAPFFKVTVFTTVLWIIKKSSSSRRRDDTIKKMASGTRGGHLANLLDSTAARR